MELYCCYSIKLREFLFANGLKYKLAALVCHGNKRMINGYIWRFYGDDYDKYSIKKKSEVAIDKFDIYGNYIQTYNSIKDATKSIGNTPASIQSVLRNRT